jgi:hypothetical protein
MLGPCIRAVCKLVAAFCAGKMSPISKLWYTNDLVSLVREFSLERVCSVLGGCGETGCAGLQKN